MTTEPIHSGTSSSGLVARGGLLFSELFYSSRGKGGVVVLLSLRRHHCVGDTWAIVAPSSSFGEGEEAVDCQAGSPHQLASVGEGRSGLASKRRGGLGEEVASTMVTRKERNRGGRCSVSVGSWYFSNKKNIRY